MNGYDVARWIRCQEFAKDLNLILEVSGEGFWLTESNGLTCGTFHNVTDLYNFLCGYDQATSKGRNRYRSKCREKE